mgnify:FL=1
MLLSQQDLFDLHQNLNQIALLLSMEELQYQADKHLPGHLGHNQVICLGYLENFEMQLINLLVEICQLI